MPYVATLTNRQEQKGRVFYDLVVAEEAGSLPTVRHSVSWPVAHDTQARRTAVLAAAPAAALDVLKDAEIAANIQAALDQGVVTFRYTTPSENIAAVCAAYQRMTRWDAVRMGNFLNGWGLTNAQITNFFGHTGSGIAAFRTRLANAASIYNSVVATQGE